MQETFLKQTPEKIDKFLTGKNLNYYTCFMLSFKFELKQMNFLEILKKFVGSPHNNAL